MTGSPWSRRRGAHRRRAEIRDGPRARPRARALAALANLEANRQRLDDLNVYPVPDGDTGTNLTLTVRAIVEALDALRRPRAPEAVAKELSRAALMGARGTPASSSARSCAASPRCSAQHDDVDGPVLARRLPLRERRGVSRSARGPSRGRCSPSIREMAEEAERTRGARRSEGRARCDAVVGRGEDAVARTPELLAVLREAGVVDAGGAGLLEIVRGLARGRRRRAAPGRARRDASELALRGDPPGAVAVTATAPSSSSRARGSTRAARARARAARRLAARRRRSDALLKVHVHTDDPGARARPRARGSASIEGDRDRQHAPTRPSEREERPRSRQRVSTAPTPRRPGSSSSRRATATGRLFESYGASHVIEGGQTMNPSTARDRGARSRRRRPRAVIVLPNNSNVLLTRRAGRSAVAAKHVRVVATSSVQAGAGGDRRASCRPRRRDENEAAMRDAIRVSPPGR